MTDKYKFSFVVSQFTVCICIASSETQCLYHYCSVTIIHPLIVIFLVFRMYDIILLIMYKTQNNDVFLSYWLKFK